MAEADDDGAVFAGSGSFRVERSRALAVLSRYQLPEPWMYLLPLARCAAAGGAATLSVTPEPGAVELAFDGRPLPRAALDDPYAALLAEEGTAGRAERELALGLLAALRLAPGRLGVRVTDGAFNVVESPGSARVRVRSGGVCLTAEGLDGERVSPDRGAPPAGAVVRVESAHAALWGPEHGLRLRRWCGYSTLRLLVAGGELGRFAGDPRGLAFEEGGTRGWVGVPARALDASVLDACALGVLAKPVRPSLPFVQVEGFFDAPGLRLDVSQSGVVEDAAYAAALAVLARQAARLLDDVARAQRDRLAAAVPSLRRRAGLTAWRARLEGREPPASGGWLDRLLGRPSPESVDDGKLAWCARVTDWLRHAALRLPPGRAPDDGTPVGRLWRAPLLLGTDWEPLSLADVVAMIERVGYVPVAQLPGGRGPGVWLTTTRDVEVLTRHFPDALRMADLGGPGTDSTKVPGEPV